MSGDLIRVTVGERYKPDGIFADRWGRTESSLHALLEALRQDKTLAVVVSGLGDLHQVGCPTGASLQVTARHRRARVITVDDAYRVGTTVAAVVATSLVAREDATSDRHLVSATRVLAAGR